MSSRCQVSPKRKCPCLCRTTTVPKGLSPRKLGYRTCTECQHYVIGGE